MRLFAWLFFSLGIGLCGCADRLASAPAGGARGSESSVSTDEARHAESEMIDEAVPATAAPRSAIPAPAPAPAAPPSDDVDVHVNQK